ncbi:hypothetical protein R6Q59_035305 [Mikania micrantha]|uniref:DUF632 domain-containing protein n=1 Tax=Mikania micrantha TaxID=192012 RepID=A0A5N6NER1_9ASTR|nr:hypothetical protein E3N88_23962 [Mikania micrantha]
MGVSNSKAETCEPLRLCKERKRFMKQAIDSRYNLAAAHVVYVQSLHNIGIAFGKLAETEVSLESSSAAQIGCNNAAGGDTNSGTNSRLDYMKSGGISAVTVNLNPSMISNSNKVYVNDVESSPLTMSPPPPPPPPPPRFSWDYFDPTDGSFRLMGHDQFQLNLKETDVDTCSGDQNGHFDDDLVDSEVNKPDSIGENGQIEQCDSKDGCLTEETEDHHPKVKDFLSSIKEIEDCFIRASKFGNEVSRMLEANQIQISYSESNGGSTGSSSSFLTCFRGENTLVLHDPPQTTKVITQKRSVFSNSSLLLLPGPPSNNDDNENFIQEFGMISGSHSSTLDRLYAWERKLYDEVKASESIRKEYVRKCDELRHQFAKDLKPHLIDKTRAVVKDLHSRMKVALHTVDAISKRIEKMRDEELQPQLIELIQGLMRMWKSMLECHHAQYITISSANHSRTQTRLNETNRMIMIELEHQVECFGSSFSGLVKSYTSYVESINNWLQNCIIQPKERVKGRRAFSPRRMVAPPIFVVYRDWSAGSRSLASQKVSDVIKEFVFHIRRLLNEEEMKSKDLGLIENGEEMKMDDVRGLNLRLIRGSLTKVFDRLTSYCEESLKMYQEINDKSQSAGNLYSNYRPPAKPSII